MPKALVLGGETGLLGRAISDELENRGWTVHKLGRKDCDLFDPDILARKIEQAAPDAVFNTIAWTQVDDAEDHAEEAAAINHVFPATLARIINLHANCWLCHFSTDFVFSGPGRTPWTETDTPEPESVYGRTKLAGERAVMAALPDRHCIIRTAWLFGPGKKNFVTTILNLCREKDSINVVDDQTGSPTYTCDLAIWTAELAEKQATGIWHGVNSGMASWYELANEAAKLSDVYCRISPVCSSQWPQKAKRPRFSALANDKLAAFLGRKPRSWPQALRAFLFRDYDKDGSRK